MTRARDVANLDGILTTKGDIFVASSAATPDRIAVGANDTVLTADATTATGLKWAAAATVPLSYGFSAGKNKIINGDFNINQRNFTTSTISDFMFDRFISTSSGGTVTRSAQLFTSNQLAINGYGEAKNFLRYVISGQSAAGDNAAIYTKIEDVRTMAGQTVTVSFYAKAATGTPKICVAFEQQFGAGGGSAVYDINPTAVTIGTTFARYSATLTIPTIAGKIVGLGSFLQLYIWLSAGSNLAPVTQNIGIQNSTFDIWGTQVEAGSVATPFQTATGTIQGELDACLRYLPVIDGPGNYIVGGQRSTTNGFFPVDFKVPPRVAPTGLTFSALSDFFMFNGQLGGYTPTSIAFNTAGTTSGTIDVGVTGGTGANPGDAVFFRANANAKILFTGCEL